MIGERQFKTTFRKGVEYLNRDRQMKNMHNDLIKLKQIQRTKNQLVSMHRLGYKTKVNMVVLTSNFTASKCFDG